MFFPSDQYLDQLTDLDAEDIRAHHQSVAASMARARANSKVFITQLRRLNTATRIRVEAEKHYSITEAKYLSSSPEDRPTLEAELFAAKDARNRAREIEELLRARVWGGQR